MIRKLLRRHRETRSGGYTELVLRGIDAKVTGSDGDALVTGAVEVAAGIWGRALASAKVEGAEALTPRRLHRIGRDLIRQGESLLEVRVAGGRVTLNPVFDWEVLEGWRYRLTLPRPVGDSVVRTVPPEAVMHVKWAENPREPWCGLSPLEAAPALGTLAGRVERAVGQDLATPLAHLLPIPTDGGDKTLNSLRNDIGEANGAAVLLEGTSTGWEEGRQHSGTKNDWHAQRLGPEIPTELRLAYRDIMSNVANACGIPPQLGDPASQGQGQREAYRRFVQLSVEPVADIIAETASEALDADVTLTFRDLWAHDLQGRASAFQRLVTGGMDIPEAVRVSGLLVDG